MHTRNPIGAEPGFCIRLNIVLLALVLSGMVLIVGNASKPTMLNMLLPEQTPRYFPIVFSNRVVNGGIEIEDGVYSIGGWGFWVGEPLDLDVEFWAVQDRYFDFNSLANEQGD